MGPDDAMDVDEQESLDLLTEEFLGRRRRGEALDVETFAAEHAAHADRIRALFPVLLQIEGARPTDPVRPRDRVGRWRIVRELGRGGMGVVYLAEDDATGERAAVKLMSTDHP
jgi:eukaryotic-like serine/threonine-protein kinase